MSNENIKLGILLFFLGFMGVLSTAPLMPQLLAMQSAPLPMSVEMIQIISVVQSSVLLLLMVWLGLVFSKKVGLKSPVILALIRSENVYKELKPQLLPALIGGIIGGILILSIFASLSNYLPPDFLSASKKLITPWYTKILYGGITEELLIRWGLMSFLVWGIYRLTQKDASSIRSYNYVIAIIISALIFGLGHLPAAFALSPEITITLIIYIILSNAVFGFIAGYLYWKHGLECAIGGHMIAHLIMIIGSALI